MTFYVVDAGEEAFLDLLLAVGYTAKLFTNDVTSGLTDAQIEALAAGDFTEATFPGYSSKSLTGGSWTTTQDDPSTGVYAAQTWTRSSTGTAQVCYGVFYTQTSGGALRWFETFDTPISVEFLNDAIVWVPKITLGDEQDTNRIARGVVAQAVATDNDGPHSADAAITDMALSNVSVEAGRIYGIHVHTQVTMAGADAQWNLLVRLNGATLDRAAALRNTTDAVGTFASETFTVDAMVFWEPTVTQATDDLDLFADEVAGTGTVQLDGAATAQRTFTLIDFGMAP